MYQDPNSNFKHPPHLWTCQCGNANSLSPTCVKCGANHPRVPPTLRAYPPAATSFGKGSNPIPHPAPLPRAHLVGPNANTAPRPRRDASAPPARPPSHPSALHPQVKYKMCTNNPCANRGCWFAHSHDEATKVAFVGSPVKLPATHFEATAGLRRAAESEVKGDPYTLSACEKFGHAPCDAKKCLSAHLVGPNAIAAPRPRRDASVSRPPSHPTTAASHPQVKIIMCTNNPCTSKNCWFAHSDDEATKVAFAGSPVKLPATHFEATAGLRRAAESEVKGDPYTLSACEKFGHAPCDAKKCLSAHLVGPNTNTAPRPRRDASVSRPPSHPTTAAVRAPRPTTAVRIAANEFKLAATLFWPTSGLKSAMKAEEQQKPYYLPLCSKYPECIHKSFCRAAHYRGAKLVRCPFFQKGKCHRPIKQCNFAHGSDDSMHIAVRQPKGKVGSELKIPTSECSLTTGLCFAAARVDNKRKPYRAKLCLHHKCPHNNHCRDIHWRNAVILSDWQCNLCDATNKNDAQTCANCESLKPDDMFSCPQCGTYIATGESCKACRGKDEAASSSTSEDEGDDNVTIEAASTEAGSDTSERCSNEGSNSDGSGSDTDNWSDSDFHSVQSGTSNVKPFAPVSRGKHGQFNQLPIFAARDRIVNEVYLNKLLICKAETGSGKTTQLPQYFADRSDLFPGVIVCTQPRQIAASTIARRVADEYDGVVDDQKAPRRPHLVKFATHANSPGNPRILFMTEDTLIRTACVDRNLSNISVLIVDEAHERNMNTDIVLGIAKRLLEERKDFHVVVASATIDPTKFIDHFRRPKVTTALEVPGRTFPVDVDYKKDFPSQDLMPIHGKLVDLVIAEMKKTDKHVLIFLPTQRDIEQCVRSFSGHPGRQENWVALPLTGSLPPEEQRKVTGFTADPLNKVRRMVAFATNVAETSLTIDGICLVIDTGVENRARYDAARRLTVLELARISQSSADQRKGRAGRIEKGRCIRLFDYDACEPTSTPEMLRSSLESVCLRICALPDSDPLTFPFVDRPNSGDVFTSLQMLLRIQCVDKELQITPKGKDFFSLPFDPCWSEFVYMAARLGGLDALNQAIVVAAVQCAPGNIFFWGKSKEEKQEKKRMVADLNCGNGDLHFALGVVEGFLNAKQSKGRSCGTCKSTEPLCRCQKKYAIANSLNQKVMKAIVETLNRTTRPIKDMVPQAFLGAANRDPHWLGKSLVRAFPTQVVFAPSPANPNAGIVTKEGMMGRIDESSIFASVRSTTISQSTEPSCFFVAGVREMTRKTTQAKDTTAPIQPTTIFVQGLERTEPGWWAEMGVGSEMPTFPRREFDVLHSDALGPFFSRLATDFGIRDSTILDNSESGKFRFWGPTGKKSEVLQIIKAAKERILKFDTRDEVLQLCNGRLTITVRRSNFEIKNVSIEASSLDLNVAQLLDQLAPAKNALKFNNKNTLKQVLAQLAINEKHIIGQPRLDETRQILSLRFTSHDAMEVVAKKHDSLLLKRRRADKASPDALLISFALNSTVDCTDQVRRIVGDTDFTCVAHWSASRGKLTVADIDAVKSIKSNYKKMDGGEIEVDLQLDQPPPTSSSAWRKRWNYTLKLSNVKQIESLLNVPQLQLRSASTSTTRIPPSITPDQLRAQFNIPLSIEVSRNAVIQSQMFFKQKFAAPPPTASLFASTQTSSATDFVLYKAVSQIVATFPAVLSATLPMAGIEGISLCLWAQNVLAKAPHFKDLVVTTYTKSLTDHSKSFPTYDVKVSGVQDQVTQFGLGCWKQHAEILKHSTFVPMNATLSSVLKRVEAKLNGDWQVSWNQTGLFITGSNQAEHGSAKAKVLKAIGISLPPSIPCVKCKSESLMVLQKCGHSVCRNCVRQCVTTDPSLKCPEKNCDKTISMDDCPIVAELEPMLLRKIIANQKSLNVTECKRCNAGFIRCAKAGTHTGRCSGCEVDVCLKCFDVAHHGRLCAAEEERLRKERFDNFITSITSTENIASFVNGACPSFAVTGASPASKIAFLENYFIELNPYLKLRI